MVKETDGEVASGAKAYPLRKADCSLAGTREQISSSVILPETRIPSIPETGTESNSGDLTTEWNIDEQDEMFASVMCSSWEDVPDSSTDKTLSLGTKRSTYSFMKKYSQAPVEYQLFKNEQFNQVQIDMSLNSFVNLTWSLMGSNHPKSVTNDPLADKSVDYQDAMTTKSFKTLEGSIKIGDTADSLVAFRQCPAFSLTINNNMEAVQALFEEEAIEQSLGDFVVSGSFDFWKADTTAMNLSNDAIDGKEKYIQVTVSREVNGVTTSYVIDLIVHLDSTSESKDGNKLKNTVNFTMGRADGIKFTKTVA